MPRGSADVRENNFLGQSPDSGAVGEKSWLRVTRRRELLGRSLEAETAQIGAKDMLLRQLTSPVRWSTEMRNIAGHFPEALYVEMGPGNVLTGLMGRLVKGAKTFACGTASEVDKLLQMVA